MDYRKGLLFILIALEILLSIYLIYANVNGNSICMTGKGCESVQTSSYANLFGVKLTDLAIVAFIALFIVYYLVYIEKVHYNFFFGCTLVGAGLAAYFIYLQLFILKEICSNCLIVDGVMILIFVVSGIEFLLIRKGKGKPPL